MIDPFDRIRIILDNSLSFRALLRAHTFVCTLLGQQTKEELATRT